MVFKEEMQEILKTIIGEGVIKQGGSSQTYSKGDVMKYKNGSKWYLYKCKRTGSYSIPDETNFKRIDLRG
ncbi:hypothetical protein [Streptobacillus canis]|uniref:hypothetical protein n=1 Tax=Streptobacillus canis TaxID=2678686 RepID=UPI0012E2D9BF|nr:hypothetical protein [Streptobacillus canis]